MKRTCVLGFANKWQYTEANYCHLICHFSQYRLLFPDSLYIEVDERYKDMGDTFVYAVSWYKVISYFTQLCIYT